MAIDPGTAAIIASIISSVVGGGLSYIGDQKEQEGIEEAAGYGGKAAASIYQPNYLSKVDEQLYYDMSKLGSWEFPSGLDPYMRQIISGQKHAAGYAQPYYEKYLAEAFEPKGELYDYYAGKLSEGALGRQSAVGLGTSPYGQDIVNQILEQYTMDYLSDEFARRTAALPTYTTGVGQHQKLGESAMGTAINLELAKMKPLESAIGARQAYLGTGIQAGGAQAPYIAGQAQYPMQLASMQAQPWQQAGAAAGDLSSSFMKYYLLQNLLGDKTTKGKTGYPDWVPPGAKIDKY